LSVSWPPWHATSEQYAAQVRACTANTGGTVYMLTAGYEVFAETPDEGFRAFCVAASWFRAVARIRSCRGTSTGSQ
jgi:hypothetical protein